MSDFATSLHFLRPEWFWALMALPLIVGAWHWRRRRLEGWRDVVDPALRRHVIEQRAAGRHVVGLALQCIAWTLAVVALSGPSWRTGEQALVRGGAPLVIALDLSDATLAGDLPPSRLLQARAKLAQLLRARNGKPTGLVAYAGDAFTVAPLTEDTANVSLFLDALAPDVMPEGGSDTARGIEMASLLLMRAGHANGDILLLTDHASSDAASAAARALAAGHRVSVLGMGTAAGAAYRRSDGSIAHARLDAASLSALATAGGGRVVAWTEKTDAIATSLARAGGVEREDGVGARTWRDEGYWLLIPLLLLALFAFRRGSAIAVLALCFLLPLPQAQAQSSGTPPAEGGWWQRADQAQHARMREGIDAFRAEDLDGALRAWQGLSGAEAAYNRGNALAKKGEYTQAIAAYDEALRAQPGMADAIANRKAVEAAMQRRPSQGGGDRSDRADEGDDGDPQSGEGQSDGSPAKKGEGAQAQQQQPQAPAPADDRDAETSRAQQREPSGDASPQPPQDVSSQREADDAQRERMQRALQQSGGQQAQDGEHVEGAPDRAESAAEREKRQANEAWLRRIPDDPGGLLRAKFKLEHERRQGGGSAR